MKSPGLITKNNRGSGSSIESLLAQSFPNHLNEISQSINEFNNKELSFKDLARKLNETIGNQNFAEFINWQFNNFNSALGSDHMVKTLKVDVNKMKFTSISKTLSNSNKWRWSVLPFKVNYKSKLLSFGLKGWQYFYSRTPLLWWVTNNKHYILSLIDFTLKRIHWYDGMPPYPGMHWIKLIGGKITLSGSAPQERKDHSSTLVSNHEIFIFGGESKGQVFNDSFILDVDFMHWHSVVSADEMNVPSARHGHSAVLAQNNIYVFGGTDSNGNDLNDLYVMELYSFPSELHKKHEITDADKKYMGRWRLISTEGRVPAVRSHHSCDVIQN